MPNKFQCYYSRKHYVLSIIKYSLFNCETLVVCFMLSFQMEGIFFFSTKQQHIGKEIRGKKVILKYSL